jgi:hypothetical protein
MKKAITLLSKIRLPRLKSDEKDSEAFDRRMKKVNRARMVNQVGLGGPVFRNRQSETEA